MTGYRPQQDLPLVDEASWAYLIVSDGDRGAGGGLLRERLAQTCEEGGWSAVCRSSTSAEGAEDPGRLFEAVRHSVGNADFVVALLGPAGGSADAELGMAYGHGRPIVGIRLAGGRSSISETQAMIDGYERARVIACDGPDACALGLREVLSDPGFVETVRSAAREHV